MMYKYCKKQPNPVNKSTKFEQKQIILLRSGLNCLK